MYLKFNEISLNFRAIYILFYDSLYFIYDSHEIHKIVYMYLKFNEISLNFRYLYSIV